jgi:cytochrome c-type biogenesis protein
MPEISNIGVLTAFAAGAISFLSPCVLPLVPGYVSYVAGESAVDGKVQGGLSSRLKALGLSLYFVLGFSTVFVLLGASATALGQLLLSYRYELNIISGIVVIIFGLFVTGLLRWSWMARDVRFHAALEGGRPLSAYALGLAFAFGWTPCIGPILGAILTVSAATTTVAGGVVLLAIYSLGLGVPFLLAAIFTDALARRLRQVGRVGRWLKVVAGAAMVLMGLAMVTGQMSVMAYWFLDTFPILAKIG